MRNTVAIFLTLIALSPAAPGELEEPVRLLDDDIPHAAPFFSDLDGDGRKDLLVGQFRQDPYTNARVQWFRNLGEPGKPKWAKGSWLQAGGSPVAVDEFCHTGFGPQVIDFDGDGIEDLVSGSRDCRLTIFPGLGEGRFGTERSIAYIADEKDQLPFRYNTRIFVDDWDQDGALDILAARKESIWWIRNAGAAKQATAVFEKPIPVVTMEGKNAFQFDAVAVADWDQDGKSDLIAGTSDGRVAWYANQGLENELPRLARNPQTLIEGGRETFVKTGPAGEFEEPASPTRKIRLCVTDYNGDGLPDILLGDAWMKSRTFDAGHSGPAQEPTVKAAHRLKSRLTRELRELQQEPENETAAAAVARKVLTREKAAECSVAWKACYGETGQRTTRHGRVWLFVRSSL